MPEYLNISAGCKSGCGGDLASYTHCNLDDVITNGVSNGTSNGVSNGTSNGTQDGPDAKKAKKSPKYKWVRYVSLW